MVSPHSKTTAQNPLTLPSVARFLVGSPEPQHKQLLLFWQHVIYLHFETVISLLHSFSI